MRTAPNQRDDDDDDDECIAPIPGSICVDTQRGKGGGEFHGGGLLCPETFESSSASSLPSSS